MKQFTETELRVLLEEAYVEGFNENSGVDPYRWGTAGVGDYDKNDMEARRIYVDNILENV